MDLNAKKVTRSVYTFWTVIGEVGALNGVLINLASFVISVFGFQKSMNYLASELYELREPETYDADSLSKKLSLNSAG